MPHLSKGMNTKHRQHCRLSHDNPEHQAPEFRSGLKSFQRVVATTYDVLRYGNTASTLTGLPLQHYFVISLLPLRASAAATFLFHTA